MGGAGFCRRRGRGFRREGDALAAFLGVEREHGVERDVDEDFLAAEARGETHAGVVDVEHLDRARVGVEHDLAVFDVARRHLHASDGRVHEQVRREAVVEAPVARGAQQVGFELVHAGLRAARIRGPSASTFRRR